MHINRRDFLLSLAAASGGVMIPHVPSANLPVDGPRRPAKQRPEDITIQEVIDRILGGLPSEPNPETVDTVKIGDTSRPVTGVVTTFLATAAVVEAAAADGANLVITHEPTFYNHFDEVDWLAKDPVYRAKVALIEEHGIVVWRLHDHVHRRMHDDITDGVFAALGWKDYADPDDNYICTLPDTSLRELAAFLKDRLGSASARTVGDEAMICSRVGVLMGAWGGRRQIEILSRPDVDVLVCGEINEWETCEYVRDAHTLGFKKGLVVVGHAVSEEPGMLWMTDWIRAVVPEVEVVHVPALDPFAYL